MSEANKNNQTGLSCSDDNNESNRNKATSKGEKKNKEWKKGPMKVVPRAKSESLAVRKSKVEKSWLTYLKKQRGDAGHHVVQPPKCRFCLIDKACEWDTDIGEDLRLFGRTLKEREPLTADRNIRHLMYREYINKNYGWLAGTKRIPLPWCVELAIKQTWPGGLADGKYAFFQDNL